MKILPAYAALILCSFTAFFSPIEIPSPQKPVPATPREPKIQAAILLDVSNSMDGLIEQAKVQLWNMVSVMGKVKCENGIPKIEIALYEYGKDSNDPNAGFIRQITPFSSDLDNLSELLFQLTTNGGSEYCGEVINTSLDQLTWDTASTNYKVIFIAGNEDFLQGKISYTMACEKARKKGVIVNTIYCGNRETGIREHWNLGGECGRGSYTFIDQNAKLEDIVTPYDDSLFQLNTQLNKTYIGYGATGFTNLEKQQRVDRQNEIANKSAAAKRISVKANAAAYSNSSWDLVDAFKADSVRLFSAISKDQSVLPDSLRGKTQKDINQFIKAKSEERSNIQKRIAQLSVDREKYISNERRNTERNNTATLESEVEKIIREQVKRFAMYVE